MTSSADVKTMVDRTRETLGKIDILVNNAGVAGPPGMPFTNNTEEDWDRTFAVNTKSVFLTCKAITPLLHRAQGGTDHEHRLDRRADQRADDARPTAWPRGRDHVHACVAKELAPTA